MDLVNELRDCFAIGLDELGMTNITERHTQLHNSSPVSCKPVSHLPYSERLVVRNPINEVLLSKIMQESNSPFVSPIVLVGRKITSTVYVDYRVWNKKTIKDLYPIK